MKLKKEYIILSVIIVALILYLVLHKTDGTHYQLPVLSEISGNRITRLEIGKAGDTIVLNKKDKTWYIGSEQYPAASGKIKNMLDVIAKLTVTALVSKSQNYIRYDLNADKKINIKAWEGKTLAREFEIGKAATTFQHTFVKLEKDANVYHARGDFKHKFDQTIDKLRDKTVLSFEQNDIREVHISKAGSKIVISQKEIPVTGVEGEEKGVKAKSSPTKKTERIWQTAENKKLDESKVKRLLSSLSKLDCEKYINDSKKEDFQNPDYFIRLKGADEYSISIFAKTDTDKDAKNHPAISSENDYPFLLSDSQVDNVKTIIEEMLAANDRK
jgi:hypothetical protein